MQRESSSCCLNAHLMVGNLLLIDQPWGNNYNDMPQCRYVNVNRKPCGNTMETDYYSAGLIICRVEEMAKEVGD